ncbi:MAG: glycosyltransferase [Pseudobdellovibrionaceae bacterium]
MLILIPAYNPNDQLIKLTQELVRALPQAEVIVVNDGSSDGSADIFSQLRKFEQVEVLQHALNFGKGRAIKTAINHGLLKYPDCDRMITVDADGQHQIADLLKMVESPLRADEILLGVRHLPSAKTPLRSLFGNRSMSLLFFVLTGINLKDTQTGLRAFSPKLAKDFLILSADRYEFEMDMLIWCRKNKIRFRQVPIETVYIDDNQSSHFNPILDSLKISFTMLRFAFSSLLTSMLDMAVFTLLFSLSGQLLMSLLGGRALAAIFNFSFNRKAVFKKAGRGWASFFEYLILLGLMTSAAYYMIQSLVEWTGWPVLAAKVISETTIFILNFSVQRVFIFRGPDHEA